MLLHNDKKISKMEYKISKFKWNDVMLEKHMESKGFFRNVSGSSKVGEIALLDFTEKGIINYFTENDKVYYMELGSVNGFNFPYRGEASRKFIKNCKNIPVEERIKFLYETLSSNSNYNCLGIKYKDPGSRRHFESIFEINDVSSSDSYEEQDSYAEKQLPLEEQGWFDDSDDDDVDDDIASFTIDDYIGF